MINERLGCWLGRTVGWVDVEHEVIIGCSSECIGSGHWCGEVSVPVLISVSAMNIRLSQVSPDTLL